MTMINRYDLFLFDLDGLLIDTEPLHYLAYKNMCFKKGFELTWSFEEYCKIAHQNSDALKKALLKTFPQLYTSEEEWQFCYEEKQRIVHLLLKSQKINLMPGVAFFLERLFECGKRLCVVTHSNETLVQAIRSHHPLLEAIPNWITRNHYQMPKPHPESYLSAIKLYGHPEDKIIGFEDTPRGIYSLLKTPAKPIIISQVKYPELEEFSAQGVSHYSSFEEINHL